MGGEQLHEQDREDDQHVDEVPGHHHRFVEVSIKTGFGADVPGAIAGEVSVQFGEGQLSQEEDHQADAQEAEPQGATLVGGGSIHCRPQDGDETRYYGCHRQSWLLLGISTVGKLEKCKPLLPKCNYIFISFLLIVFYYDR